jgi:hypothetical protein
MKQQDFFYVCPAHLRDAGFCTPKIDKEAEEARKKKELEAEVERVKKEYEEKQRKKKEEKEKKDKDKDKKEEGKEKKEEDKETKGDEVSWAVRVGEAVESADGCVYLRRRKSPSRRSHRRRSRRCLS